MKYKGYAIIKTRIRNPKYSYRAKKGKNVLYERTQGNIKRLIRQVIRNETKLN